MPMSRKLLVAVASLGLLLAACGGTGTGTALQTVVFLPGYSQGATPTPSPAVPLSASSNIVSVALGETDATHMYIHMSSTTVPSGKVTFVVTNEGQKTHEFVVLATDAPAASFPIVSFEGEANRINEDAKGVTNVGETGDMAPGTSKKLVIDLQSGHYAAVCNLPGHYGMGMHEDLWAIPAGSVPVAVGLGETDATHMYIHLAATAVPSGPVSFMVANEGSKTHEFVVLASDTPAANFRIVSFEGEPNRINEDAKGVTNVGETGDMEPGSMKLLTIDVATGHYAVVCNLPGHYGMGMHADFWVTPEGSTPVTVGLGETDSTHMYIHLSEAAAPSGPVSFIVTNEGQKKHEFVVLSTKTMAAGFPIVSFEGEPNRINEDAKGVVNVGETGDMDPGTSKMLTIDLQSGHYAVVCNLPGHYGMGMHQDFWATPKGSTPVTVTLGETDPTHMFIDMSATSATAGTVSFVVTNEGSKTHEFVVLATDTPAADFPIVSFEGEPNRINEDAKGVVNVGETGDMEPATSKMLTIDLKSGHYAVVCNLPGHYGMGMRQDLWVTPRGATTITVSLGETDSTHMYIHLSQGTAPMGKVAFVVTNEGSKTHEFVVLATDTPAADFAIGSFEGEANRINEDAKGVTNVGETGDMESGTMKLLTIDLKPGHYAVVCNLPGHYAMGMHQDFWVA